jgi:hypothetical protein
MPRHRAVEERRAIGRESRLLHDRACANAGYERFTGSTDGYIFGKCCPRREISASNEVAREWSITFALNVCQDYRTIDLKEVLILTRRCGFSVAIIFDYLSPNTGTFGANVAWPDLHSPWL